MIIPEIFIDLIGIRFNISFNWLFYSKLSEIWITSSNNFAINGHSCKM